MNGVFAFIVYLFQLSSPCHPFSLYNHSCQVQFKVYWITSSCSISYFVHCILHMHFNLFKNKATLTFSNFTHLQHRLYISKYTQWGVGSVLQTLLHYGLQVVLATGPGNPPAVGVLTGGSFRFSFRPSQKPDPLCLGGFVTRTGHRTAGIWLGWNRTAVPNIWFLLLWLQLSIWVLIVSWHSQYVNCSALAPLSPPLFKFAIWLIFVEWLWNNGWF